MNSLTCAVVVTHHPDHEFEHRILTFLAQVGGLVVVDNGSTGEEVLYLRALAAKHSFTLIENPENLGLGTALNEGVRWVQRARKFRFVVFFDQDSEASNGFIDALVACFDEHSANGRVAVVGPRIYIRSTGATDGPRGIGNGTHRVAQTSGSLMPLEVFESEGWFNEDFFIDYVDYEYCLRLAAAGWRTLYCDRAVLSHLPGNASRHSIFGIYLCTTFNYSPLRHYYSLRNALWVIRDYSKRYPHWCGTHALSLLRSGIKVVIFESSRYEKMRMALFAVRDVLLGRLGKYSFNR